MGARGRARPAPAAAGNKELVLNEVVAAAIRWALRIMVFVMGAVLFLSLLAAACLLALMWAARALWARLTGRPATPWAMRMDPRAGWSTVRRSTARWTAQQAGTPGAGRASVADVTDVQPREIR